ncbi:MAG: M23 family metallopeptidase [Deltaproteobacteria bacterium]|nr:M23 family metallopeptidase [Deltaproteobacteria bacterium]
MSKRIFLLVFLIIFAGCTAAGRTASKGVYHTVKAGETLWRISRTYEVDMQEVAEMNNIKDPTMIKSGQRIFISGAARTLDVPPPKQTIPIGEGDAKNAVIEEEPRLRKEPERFLWPIKGEIAVPFGMRAGEKHDGIDIRAPLGTLFCAAGDGEVVHTAEDMRGFGYIIIIRHEADFYTVYAHNEKNLVKNGDRVKAGEHIGTVGRSGSASEPLLHFEVREGKKIRNPLFFLP